jgi:uncharacterized repeat protein (TIGR03803 family)
MERNNRLARFAALLTLCAAAAMGLRAQTLTILATFDGANGAAPYVMSLVQGFDGNLYGTTAKGGTGGNGTVFRISPGGKLITLHRFLGTDGRHPYAGLALSDSGDFWGTTAEGGTRGYGTAFKITQEGTLTALHNFCDKAKCPDGAGPVGVLTQATDGDFYGTTNVGGTGYLGTMFKVTPSGTLTTLFTFSHVGHPVAGLVQTTGGNFYGTADGGFGMVFTMTPSGVLTPLYLFCSPTGCSGGWDPSGELTQGADGNFYGTTSQGGGAPSSGTIFQMEPAGTLTTLYRFCTLPDCIDGAYPYAGLAQGTDGNFYGTTQLGGLYDAGTIFQFTPAGTLTTLYSFCAQSGCPDGTNPLGGLVQATDGNFYGTTSAGEGNSCFDRVCGTVFKLSMGLPPFVKALQTVGRVGAQVKILGTNLTGAASVTFNGTPAAFTVLEPSLITTTVPAGATTGTIQVVSPGGTLSSSVPFRVAP